MDEHTIKIITHDDRCEIITERFSGPMISAAIALLVENYFVNVPDFKEKLSILEGAIASGKIGMGGVYWKAALTARNIEMNKEGGT